MADPRSGERTRGGARPCKAGLDMDRKYRPPARRRPTRTGPRDHVAECRRFGVGPRVQKVAVRRSVARQLGCDESRFVRWAAFLKHVARRRDSRADAEPIWSRP